MGTSMRSHNDPMTDTSMRSMKSHNDPLIDTSMRSMASSFGLGGSIRSFAVGNGDGEVDFDNINTTSVNDDDDDDDDDLKAALPVRLQKKSVQNDTSKAAKSKGDMNDSFRSLSLSSNDCVGDKNDR